MTAVNTINYGFIIIRWHQKGAIMHLNDPKDASSVKNNIKYANIKSNVSLNLSLMSELKKFFSHQLWKHQADVNSSGSFYSWRQLNLLIT